MRIKLGSGLLAINILAGILALIITFNPGDPIRIILGLFFVLFFPGYIAIAALFPRKASMKPIELLTLSFGLSILITSIIGLTLNYTPWGLRLDSILYFNLLFSLVVSGTAWLRSRRLPKLDRRDYSFTIGFPNLGQNGFDRTLSIVLIITIMGALGIIGYVVARSSETGQKFTEFYILGIGGKATDYPTDFTLQNGLVVSVSYGNLPNALAEQYGHLTVGIVNHEGQITNYTVKMQIDGTDVNIPFEGGRVNQIGPITLTPQEKWEQEIGIVPKNTGDNQNVQIFLYKNGGTVPYSDLNLTINVN